MFTFPGIMATFDFNKDILEKYVFGYVGPWPLLSLKIKLAKTQILNWKKKKVIFKFKDDFMWPFMTSEVLLYQMKSLRLHNISNPRIFYKNQFINEYASKKKAKFSESQSLGVSCSRSFLVRYRRSYVLKNIDT